MTHHERASKARVGRGIWKTMGGIGILNLALIGLMALFLWKGGFVMEGRGQVWFGASFPNLNNSFYHELAMELDASIQARGHRLMIRDCGLDPALQAAHIRQMVRQGVEAVFVCPAEEGALDEALRECLDAGVAVVMVGDGQAAPGRAAVTSDNENAGRQLANFLKGDCASARILVISAEHSEACAARQRGFAEALKDVPGFEILQTIYVQDHMRSAMDATENVLSAGLDFDTVFAANDGLGIGAYAALQNRGKADGVRILSVDGGPEGKRMVKNGLFEATAQQYPFLIARRAVECAFQGKPEGEWIKVPVKLITRNIIASYDLDKWD